MEKYDNYIDPKRRSVPTPKDLVNKDGTCVFGTFDKEFETMDLVHAKKPTKFIQAANKLRLTLWEASEIHFKEGILLAVVCDMGVFGKTLHVFYDKRTKKVYTWDNNLKSKDTKIAPNLLDGNISEAKTDVSHVKYINHFEKGEAHIEGHHTKEENHIEYNVDLKRISLPSVVSIPFGKNRPLYTQKDFFKVEGTITINGEVLTSDEETVAVIDDHRGYYPHSMHYDWITTMGRNEINGKKEYLAFNLTHNQSVDQEKYNENLIWLEGKTSLLPPFKIEKSIEIKDFKDYAEWLIKDEHDMVNIKFKIYGISPMIVHAVGIVMIDYYVLFGELEGYIRNEDGTKYILDGMLGMGEDKSMKF